jgi:CheY-like chemotaxis protein
MSAAFMQDRLPSDVGDSDAYNRLQMRRAIQMRGDPTVETPIGTDGESLRVLIVDDYQATADTTSKLVGVWGHDVKRAYDGTTALALAATYQPDVLLLDIQMPNMSGPELARQVRQTNCLNGCFIVAITGCADQGHRLQCEAAGIDLFLIKPVCPSILRALLIWESDYVLRKRQDTAMREVLPTSGIACDRRNPLPPGILISN